MSQKKADKADVSEDGLQEKIKRLKSDLSQREKQITKQQRKIGNSSATSVAEETEIDPFGKSRSRGWRPTTKNPGRNSAT